MTNQKEARFDANEIYKFQIEYLPSWCTTSSREEEEEKNFL